MTHIKTSPQPSQVASKTISDAGLLRGSLVLAAFAMLGCGLLYSLAGVGVGQLLFPHAANGSLITLNGVVAGSTLVAQPFSDARYFHPRPSAASYNPIALAGSNQARTNVAARERIEAERLAVAQREGVDPMSVPGDLMTQSGGGIDPHVSPASAALQIARVARARSLELPQVESVVQAHTEGKQWGLFGQPRVNVLELNLALDSLSAAMAEPQANGAR